MPTNLCNKDSNLEKILEQLIPHILHGIHSQDLKRSTMKLSRAALSFLLYGVVAAQNIRKAEKTPRVSVSTLSFRLEPRKNIGRSSAAKRSNL